MRRSGRRRLRRRLAVGVLGVVGGLYWVALTPTGAAAEVTNQGLTCHATIGNFDVGPLDSEDDTKAVHVSNDAAVTVSMTADRVIAEYFVDVAFSFRGWRAADGTGTNSQWSSTVAVDKYARFGGGLYRVTATSIGADGRSSCTAAALVFVEADPIPGTVAGDAGAGLVGVGFMGLAGSMVKAAAGSGEGGGEPLKRGDLSGDAGIPTGILPPDDDWCFPGFIVPMLLTMALMVVGALRYIATYQTRVAPRRGGRCPQTPSCSEYGRQAYEQHGFWRATRLTWRRLRSCRETPLTS